MESAGRQESEGSSSSGGPWANIAGPSRAGGSSMQFGRSDVSQRTRSRLAHPYFDLSTMTTEQRVVARSTRRIEDLVLLVRYFNLDSNILRTIQERMHQSARSARVDELVILTLIKNFLLTGDPLNMIPERMYPALSSCVSLPTLRLLLQAVPCRLTSQHELNWDNLRYFLCHNMNTVVYVAPERGLQGLKRVVTERQETLRAAAILLIGPYHDVEAPTRGQGGRGRELGPGPGRGQPTSQQDRVV